MVNRANGNGSAGPKAQRPIPTKVYTIQITEDEKSAIAQMFSMPTTVTPAAASPFIASFIEKFNSAPATVVYGDPNEIMAKPDDSKDGKTLKTPRR